MSIRIKTQITMRNVSIYSFPICIKHSILLEKFRKSVGLGENIFNEIRDFLSFFFFFHRQNYMQNYSYEIYAIIIKTASHKYCDGESLFFFFGVRNKKKKFILNSKYDEDFIVLINKTLKWWMLMTSHLFRNIEKTHLNFSLHIFFLRPGGFYFVQFVLKVFDLSLFMN